MSSLDGREHADGAADTDFRLALAVAETYARSGVGGYLYLVGWTALVWPAGLHVSHAWQASGVAFAFLAAAMLRQRTRPPAAATAQRRWIVRYTGIVLVSTLLWGAVQVWVLRDEQFGATLKNVSLIGTIAYSTVFAHLYATIARLAVGGIVMMIVPTLIALWTDERLHAMAGALSLYSLYLAIAVVRSHREYQRRLDLHEALRKQRDLYERLSRIDALTGLYNRRHFSAMLEAATRRASANGGAVTLMLLDVDHFKSVNDRHGHAVGDAALRAMADRLQYAFAGSNAVLARIGGEEFAVIIEGIGEAAAIARAEKFRSALESTPLACEGHSLAITASIGVAAFDRVRHADDDGFYGAVDAALYAAKARGRNRVLALSAM